MDVESNDARVIECVQAAYGLFPVGRDTAPLHLRVVVSDGPAPGPQSYRAYRDWFHVVAGAENHLTCDLARREAVGFFTTGLVEDRETFREGFLDAFTYMTLQRHWLTPFHAACVVIDGVGICLAGGSGSGKSTLTYAALKSGLGLLSDNSVHVLNANVGEGFRGNPARLRVRPSASALFPELRDMPAGDVNRGKPFIAVPARELFPSQMATRAAAGPIVFLDRGDYAKATFSRVPAAEAFERLFADRNPAIDEPHVMRASRRAIEELTRDGAYRMHYSTWQHALECLHKLPLLQRTSR